MRYQQFAFHAYCGASFQDGVAVGKGFRCAPFWGVQICDYSAAWISCTAYKRRAMYGASFINRARNSRWCVFSKPCCTELTLACNHRYGHLKTEHTESLYLLRRHLGNWPRSKHEKRTAGSAWETWTVAAADAVRCARVRWEINFLLTFETAPFFCVYPVYMCMCVYIRTLKVEI